MELREKLKELRTTANLTQEELANRVFVSRTLVSKWESGDRYPSKENLARLAVLFQISPEELIGTKKENDKYNKYNILSIVYSVFCGIITIGFIILMILVIIERKTLHDGWTCIGGFLICMSVLPIIIGLVFFEIITLKKKNGYKNLELYSLFSMILVWLLSLVGYLYME